MRTKWLPFYALFFLAFTAALLRFGGDPSKVTASLLNIILLVVPLVSILYSSVHWYNAEPFTGILITQPIRRSSVYISTWLAISSGLTLSFVVSTGLSLWFFNAIHFNSLFLLAIGGLLGFVFVGIGMLIAVIVADRMKGLGLIFLVWLYFSLLHDVVVFLFISSFGEYPIEIPSIGLMLINPIDLARCALLLSIDLSAMMGYTGRILQEVLSKPIGLAIAVLTLLMWTIVPAVCGAKYFEHKDL